MSRGFKTLEANMNWLTSSSCFCQESLKAGERVLLYFFTFFVVCLVCLFVCFSGFCLPQPCIEVLGVWAAPALGVLAQRCWN